MTDTIDCFIKDGKHTILSNFWMPGPRGSLEHKYQAEKAQWPDERLWVLAANGPGEAKRRGRQVALRPDWEEIKDEVMLRLLRLKFKPGSGEAAYLLSTDNAELIEGNWWGVCKGVGQNKLGKLLMQVRKELRA